MDGYSKPQIVEIGDLVDLTADPQGKFGPACDGQSGLVGNFGNGPEPPCS